MDQFIISARKYRPATFDMVVGQTAITSTLKNAIKNNVLAQAFLFTGPRGVGKTTCARIMARTINCLNPTPEHEACDQCESCVSFRNSASFNIHELDAASNNSVDDIRALVDQVRIPPQVGKYKIYIIDEVHMLSSAAFNAFLKTLEEPPAYAKFILATTEKHKIIPTILSRCQIFDFKRITVEDTVKHLQYVANKEGVEIDHDALNVIAQKADGAMRDALSVFDQMVSYSGNKITYKEVIENLNVLDYEYYFNITDAMLKGNSSSVLLMLNEIVDNGFEGQHFITGLGSHFRNVLVSLDPSTATLLETSQALRERYVDQAQKCSGKLLLNALEIQNQCDLNYARSSNKRLLIEIALLQMVALSQPKEISTSESKFQLPTAAPASAAPSAATPAAASRPASPPPVAPPSQHVAAAQSLPKPAVLQPSQSTAVPLSTPPSATVKKTQTGTFSIKEALTATEVKEEAPVIINAFSKEKLKAVWQKFLAQNNNLTPSFTTSLMHVEPSVNEHYVVTFQVDNHLVVADKRNLNHLLDHLKNELNNNQITLEPVVVESVKEKTAYTDKEKFEKMAESRPALRLFKDELGLEAEI